MTDTINAADANITAEMINNTVYFYIKSCFYYVILFPIPPSFPVLMASNWILMGTSSSRSLARVSLALAA